MGQSNRAKSEIIALSEEEEEQRYGKPLWYVQLYIALHGWEEYRGGGSWCSTYVLKRVEERKTWHGYLHRSLSTSPSFTTQLQRKR